MIRTTSLGHLLEEYESDRPDMDSWWMVFSARLVSNMGVVYVKQECQAPHRLPSWVVMA